MKTKWNQLHQLLRHPLQYYMHDMRLQHKFMISHILVLLIPTIIVSVLLYSQLSNILITMSVHSEQEIARQTVNSLENTIGTVQAASKTIAEDSNFLRFLQEESHESAITATPLLTFLNTTDALIDGVNITDIKIYLDENFSIFSDNTYSAYNIFHPMSDIRGAYWYGIFGSTDSRSLVCPKLYLTPSEAKNYGELAVIRKVSYTEGDNSQSAYIVIYFSKENIDTMLRKDISYTNGATYILNERNTLVSSSSSSLAGAYMIDYPKVTSLIPNTTEFVTLTFAGEKAYVGYKEIMGTDWYMMSVIPVNNMLTEAQDLIIQFFSIYLFFVILAFFAAFILSKSIVKRISNVINQMALVKHGKPQPLVTSKSQDEIGDLVETYNYMSDELNLLLEKQKQAANDLRISEFKALQAQINPHFLYNTLDMINWLSQSGKRGEVSEAVQALSKFYKLTLNKGNITVSIKEELVHVSLYVHLQNMRYNNKIQFIVDVSDELLDYEIPKLVLQPIVENSIQHGIFGKESKEGTIVITGWLEEKILVFIVSDNGIGIPSDKIGSLLSGTGASDTGSNIGIYNTHKRLQLFYDTNFGLTYQSREGEGTEVEIRIPAKIYEKKE